MGILLSGATVSDEALTKEFAFWKRSFLRSTCLAFFSGAVTGLLILLWPGSFGNQELWSFVRQLWTAFVECGFWFGFLVGLLWAVSRRVGAALAGTSPWTPAETCRLRGHARVFGQAGCAAAFAAVLLWLAVSFIHQLTPLAPSTANMIAQLVYAGWASSGLFILLAIGLGLVARVRS
ncbi:hypothetical protein [Noviherbaspirillum sp. ST9]|uniref:hypothetical protein n=1 Tax=Noviherbaspirillum sp. ST9 TaxID=3401606 RepID=UPI003B588FE8